MPELNRNEIIDSNLLHTILSNRRMTRYIVSIPDRAEYILKKFNSWNITVNDNGSVNVSGDISLATNTRIINREIYKYEFNRSNNSRGYIFEDSNNNYYFHMFNYLYKIDAIRYERWSNILSEFKLLSASEFTNMNLVSVSNLSRAIPIYDTPENLEYYNNIELNSTETSHEDSFRPIWSPNIELIRRQLDESSVIINETNEEIYIPTEEELRYPDVYVKRHNFTCKSKNPMIIGEWAEKFNKLIIRKLKRLGFK